MSRKIRKKTKEKKYDEKETLVFYDSKSGLVKSENAPDFWFIADEDENQNEGNGNINIRRERKIHHLRSIAAYQMENSSSGPKHLRAEPYSISSSEMSESQSNTSKRKRWQNDSLGKNEISNISLDELTLQASGSVRRTNESSIKSLEMLGEAIKKIDFNVKGTNESSIRPLESKAELRKHGSINIKKINGSSTKLLEMEGEVSKPSSLGNTEGNIHQNYIDTDPGSSSNILSAKLEAPANETDNDIISLLNELAPVENLDKPYNPVEEMENQNLSISDKDDVHDGEEQNSEISSNYDLQDESEVVNPCPFDSGQKDFIFLNALGAARRPPKIVHPRIVVSHKGDVKDYYASGLGTQYVYSENFGKVPAYLKNVKDKIECEKYITKYMLERRGFKSWNPNETVMDKIGLLSMQMKIQNGPFSLNPQTLCLSLNPSAPKHPNPNSDPCNCNNNSQDGSRSNNHNCQRQMKGFIIRDKFHNSGCEDSKFLIYRTASDSKYRQRKSKHRN